MVQQLRCWVRSGYLNEVSVDCLDTRVHSTINHAFADRFFSSRMSYTRSLLI